jgi:shikimate dehydrogenase
MKFGLIGYPLSHSFSKTYFESKFQSLGLTDFTYHNFPLAKIEDVVPLLQSDLFGLNVTIPYKSAILPYIQNMDPLAEKIGAVNTMVRTEKNEWKGYNTDIIGFKLSLEEWMEDNPFPTKALILGTGGVAKAIRMALTELGIKASFVSRSRGDNYMYEELTSEVIHDHLLIINASPVGMAGVNQITPLIPYEAVGPEHWLYDVIYNPSNTLFLSAGKDKGAHIKNGLDMLYLQAEQAWMIWKSYGKF